MALTPEQQRVLAQIKQVGRQKGASPKQVKAAIETGLVESNLRNLPGGDADSAGWRQERASLYKNPTDLNASIGRFFDETASVKDRYGRAGDLAAAVQRPAAQFRGRYQDRSGAADALLGGSSGGSSPTTSTRTVGAVDNSSQRRAAIAAFLGDKGADPVDFAMQIRSLKDTPGTQVSSGVGSMGGASNSGTGDLGGIKGRADAISRQKLPYLWGGGHQPGGGGAGQPLDCSGAVSKVLGINPRVSGQFKTFGSPGRAPGGKGVTVYASDSHVFLEVDGHYFGTSGSNPGGGAGWIKRDQISPQYLAGFTARHLAR